MNSLTKALSVINYVFGEDGKAVTPTQAASALGINLATCSRIMSDLAGQGYLDKISRRQGYIGGPLITALADRPGIYHRIATHSREALQELADQLRITVNLAIFEQGHRRILLSVPTRGGNRVRMGNVYESAGDFYGTATGRLLLSRMGKEARRGIVTRIGFPGAAWDGMDTWAELDGTLDQLRESPEISFYNSELGLWIIGAILDPPDLPAFTFGFGVTEEYKKTAIEVCRTTARKIRESFIPQETAGF